MRKYLLLFASLAFMSGIKSSACTNVIVTPGASADGSAMVSYAADSHALYGELYFQAAARYKAGSKLDIIDWDSYRPTGQIAQVRRTFQTVSNMNEKQLIIAETTWGGRDEQIDPAGIMDYGSLIYVTLQRASTAREAIDIIVDLANTYGYPSSGESFSIADTKETWVMDLVGKGADNKGIVWVARRIPDGYICAHANQARITRFPMDDPENCLFAPDVISFAREKGYFNGEDADFSFRDAYNPLDFTGARACEARAWSAFNILCDGELSYEQDGTMVTRPAMDWVELALGHDLKGEMPLFVKPARKLTMKDVADVMRDHYEGTPLDMTSDIGAGGNALPYRWRPMNFEWEGKKYINERAIATQQTGFWFVAQARGYLPDEVGALLWFGCDDAATSYLTPIYVSTKKVPECLKVGNGNILQYSPTSQFWICNRVANACYKMYNQMAPVVQAAADAYELEQMNVMIPAMDKKAAELVGKGRVRKARKLLTKYSVKTATKQFEVWKKLEELLLVKFMDGNVKAQNEDGSFKHTEYYVGSPAEMGHPEYTDKWKEAVAKDKGLILEVK